MLLDQNPALELGSDRRPKTLIVSIVVHILLILVIAFNPGWFDTTPRRIIRIAGEDFDLSQLKVTPLVLPPAIASRHPRPIASSSMRR